MEDDKVYFNWKDLVIKILFLVGFILILLWLYPNNNLKTFYDKVFNENIQTMKNAAKSYYVLDQLPSEIDEVEKMTLADMLEKELVLPFTDKDNNSCNVNKSFVEVTKIGKNEYSLKVSLTCGKQTDSIKDTIILNNCVNCGKDDTSSSDVVDDDDDDDKNFCTTKEYEFKKVTKEEEYACPTGYVKTGSYCSKTNLLDKIPAKLIYLGDKKVVKNADVNTGGSYKVYATPLVKVSYTCSTEYENAGTYNVPTTCIKKNVETTAAVKNTTYTCGPAYVNAGTYTTYTKCYGTGSKTEPAVSKTIYICSSEFDNAGTYSYKAVCKKTTIVEKSAVSKTVYICSSEYDNAGTYDVNTICYKKNKETAAAKENIKITYTCSSEYTNAGTYDVPTTCLKNKTNTAPAKENIKITYTCSSEYTNAGTYDVPTTCLKNKTNTAPATVNTKTTYTCSSEYSNAGTYNVPTTCTKTGAPSENTTPGYYTSWSCGSCNTTRYTAPKGNTSLKKYEPKGTGYGYSCSNIVNCPNVVFYYYYIVYSRSYVDPVTTYTCPTGYDNAGSYSYYVTCSKSVAATPNTKTTYICSSEYDNAGTYNVPTTCKKVVPDNAPAVQNTIKTYICSSKYDNAGTYNVPTTCKKVVPDNSPAVQNTIKTYICSSEYDNAGTYNVPTTCNKYVQVNDQSTPKTTYTCSSEYDNAGTYNIPTTCKKVLTASAYAVAKITYTCSSEYVNAGTYNIPTNCVKSFTTETEPTVKNQYICSNYYDNKGIYNVPTTCVSTTKMNNDAEVITNYFCPTSYTSSGNGNSLVCYKNMKNDDQYYCSDSSSELIGTSCVTYVKGSTKEKCDTGYLLSNGTCYKYDNQLIKAEMTTCEEKIEYIWSPTETLDGWEKTGNTRNSKVKCPEVIECIDKDDKSSCDDEVESK